MQKIEAGLVISCALIGFLVGFFKGGESWVVLIIVGPIVGALVGKIIFFIVDE